MSNVLDTKTCDETHASLLDEAVRRICSSMPEAGIDPTELRSELGRAFLNGSRSLFHLFKDGRRFASDRINAVRQGDATPS